MDNKKDISAMLIYYGNLTFGMVAFKKGNVEDACKYLLATAKKQCSPVLKRLPDMTLASELLENGKTECVIKFLKSCSKFGNRKLFDAWIKQIKAGNTSVLNRYKTKAKLIKTRKGFVASRQKLIEWGKKLEAKGQKPSKLLEPRPAPVQKIQPILERIPISELSDEIELNKQK